MGLREEKKQFLQNTIQEAALCLFSQKGYAETTLIDIAAEANVSTRTLYKYFPTKESILTRFIHENFKALVRYADELPEDMDLRDKVLSIMVRDFTTMFCPFDYVYVMYNAGRRHVGHEERRAARFEFENMATAENVYCRVFKAEQHRRGIVPDEKTEQAAAVTSAIYLHSTDLMRFQMIDLPDPETLRAFYASRLDVVWSSLEESLLGQAGSCGS